VFRDAELLRLSVVVPPDGRDRIEVLMASPQVCEQGGVPPETGLTYEFREGRLRQIR
jgi:hypothetical protein